MMGLVYLRGYPEPVLVRVRQLLASGELPAHLARKYPDYHEVQSDKALYDYAQALKTRHLRNAPPRGNPPISNRSSK